MLQTETDEALLAQLSNDPNLALSDLHSTKQQLAAFVGSISLNSPKLVGSSGGSKAAAAAGASRPQSLLRGIMAAPMASVARSLSG